MFREKTWIAAIIAFLMAFISLLNWGCEGSKPNTDGTGEDKYKHITLVNKAIGYISGGPEWFLPQGTCFFGSNDTWKNTSGAVAYGYDLNETLSSFHGKIKNASEQGQTTWLQYTCVGKPSPCGFPYGQCVQSPYAGMVCFVLVFNALRDAGYNVNGIPGDCNWFISNYTEVTGVKRIGDLVLYDFEEDGNYDGYYDHVGIVSGNTLVADPKYFNVISVIALIREFNLGAAEKRLGIYEDIPASEGGKQFQFKFVRPQ